MGSQQWIADQAALSLRRLWPRIEKEFCEEATRQPQSWQDFSSRLHARWPRLFELLFSLYGKHYDFFYHLEQLLAELARASFARPEALRQLDALREANPLWFASQEVLGGVCYADLFAQTLHGLDQRIPYLKELGLNYLHLMPLFESPREHNDGGYAVSSYRHVNSALGNMEQLRALAGSLRQAGISLCLDFVFNHTSDEHEWARRALAGDRHFQDFYYMFEDRQIPEAYERSLREIFPTVRRGSFTWNEKLGRWVWTTFHSYQWDLNYANPAVFRAMAREMLFLANVGVEVLRLDAVAFIWKCLGSSCENLAEAHSIIQAFNCVARIAAPALLFKSEAIVHPDEVLRYLSPNECQLSYNPLLMALLWEALATREVKLLEHSMRTRFRLPCGCAWINYLRSHDDIGWTFDDADARHVGIDPAGHRRFLNAFYTGRFAGSFARGLPFQENPVTGDARVSGTLASLAGLEQALTLGDPALVELAVRRILLLSSVVFSIGGIPLIYMGDELATLNDYSYQKDPAKAADSRWVHRSAFDWERAKLRQDPATPEGRVFGGLHALASLRKRTRALAGSEMEVVHLENPHLFCYLRRFEAERLLVIANFSERAQEVEANTLRLFGAGYSYRDLITDQAVSAAEGTLVLEPYQYVWLAPQ